MSRCHAFTCLLSLIALPVLAADGDPDVSYGFFGRTIAYPANDTMEADGGFMAAAYGSNGLLHVTSAARPNGGADDYDFSVTRFLPNGSVDTSFDGDGTRVVTFNRGGTNSDVARWIGIRGNGRIILAGTSDGGASNNHDLAFVQLTATGSIDTSWGSSGRTVVAVNLGSNGARTETLIRGRLLDDGRVIALGQAETDDGAVGVVVRLAAGGLRDTTFDGDGVVTVGDPGDVHLLIDSIAQPDGKLIICGAIDPEVGDSDGVMYRLDESGELDALFGDNGRRLIAYNYGDGLSDTTTSCIAHSNGSLYTLTISDVAAPLNTDLVLGRYTMDGDPFPGFTPAIVIGDAGGTFQDTGYHLREDSQGRILVVGGAARDNDDIDVMIARIYPDGSHDLDFGSSGRIFQSFQLFVPGETRTEIGVQLIDNSQDYIHVLGIASNGAATGFGMGMLRLIGDTIFEDGVE